MPTVPPAFSLGDIVWTQQQFGTLPSPVKVPGIVQRVWPNTNNCDVIYLAWSKAGAAPLGSQIAFAQSIPPANLTAATDVELAAFAADLPSGPGEPLTFMEFVALVEKINS